MPSTRCSQRRDLRPHFQRCRALVFVESPCGGRQHRASAASASSMLVRATGSGLLATALLASNGAVHRPVVRFRQSLRCLADSDPAASDSAGNRDGADGLTMGDMLAAIASRQQGELPLEDLVDETRGSIDAMLEFGSDELDEIAYEVRPRPDRLRAAARSGSETSVPAPLRPCAPAPLRPMRPMRPCAPCAPAPLAPRCRRRSAPRRSSPPTCGPSSATRAARRPKGASRPSRHVHVL